MSSDLPDATQHHEDSIYELMQYLMARCPDYYDQEMEEYVQKVLRSFRDINPGPPRPGDLLFVDALGRNYTHCPVFHSAALFNAVAGLARKGETAALTPLLERLWSDMALTYAAFFGEPPSV